MIKFIRINDFYKNILLVLSGSVLAQLIVLLSTPILTRIYTPENFGVYQLFLSVVSVITIIGTARYELAIIIPKYKTEAIHILCLSIALSVIISFSLLIGVLFLECYYVNFLTNIEFEKYRLYLPVYTLLVCFYQSFYMWFVREKEYYIISRGLVVFSLCNIALCLILYVLPHCENALIVAVILARLVVVLYFLYFFIKKYRKYIKLMQLKKIIKIGEKYNNFPKYMIFGSGVDALSSSMPTFLLNNFFGIINTGYYSLANQCLNIPSSLVSKSIGDVFRQEASRIYQKEKKCTKFYLENLKILVKVSLFFSCVIFFFAPDIFSVIFGEQWRVSGEYAKILVLMFGFGIIASPLSNIYVIAQQQRIYTGIQGLYFLSALLSFMIGGYVFLNIVVTLVFLSISFALISVISIFYGKKIAEGWCQMDKNNN